MDAKGGFLTRSSLSGCGEDARSCCYSFIVTPHLFQRSPAGMWMELP